MTVATMTSVLGQGPIQVWLLLTSIPNRQNLELIP